MKYKKKHYHIQEKEYVPHVNIIIARKENITNNTCSTRKENTWKIYSGVSLPLSYGS